MHRVIYQGEPGSNSDTLSLEVFPDSVRVPAATFEECFAAIQNGEVDVGMIPIENSLAGRVADIHHLLPDSGLHIIGEHFLPIHFQLMVLPDSSLAEIRTVHSHIHALGQCRRVIREHGWRAVVAGDTAGAAREIADRKDRSMAALAPRLAAELYGLRILMEDVEDADHNTTRFVVLSRETKTPPAGTDAITTFVFRVRNVPAALYKALGGFATNGVNITKLESYQLDGQFSATQFYADVDGHPEDPPLARALEELGFFSTKVRILGVYPRSPFRRTLRQAE